VPLLTKCDYCCEKTTTPREFHKELVERCKKDSYLVSPKQRPIVKFCAECFYGHLQLVSEKQSHQAIEREESAMVLMQFYGSNNSARFTPSFSKKHLLQFACLPALSSTAVLPTFSWWLVSTIPHVPLIVEFPETYAKGCLKIFTRESHRYDLVGWHLDVWMGAIDCVVEHLLSYSPLETVQLIQKCLDPAEKSMMDSCFTTLSNLLMPSNEVTPRAQEPQAALASYDMNDISSTYDSQLHYAFQTPAFYNTFKTPMPWVSIYDDQAFKSPIAGVAIEQPATEEVTAETITEGSMKKAESIAYSRCTTEAAAQAATRGLQTSSSLRFINLNIGGMPIQLALFPATIPTGAL